MALIITQNRYQEKQTKMSNANYTCTEYREEMILMALQKKLANADLTAGERERILVEIAELEKSMGMD